MFNRIVAVALSIALLVPQTFVPSVGELQEDLPEYTREIIQEEPGDTEGAEDIEGTDDAEDLTDSISEDASEEVQEETPESDFLEFSESKILNGVEIKVYAPAGVFPANSSLSVEAISSFRDKNKIEETLKDAINEDYEIEESYSFDIKILNEEGDEVEPDTSFGQVSVTFSNVRAKEAADDDEKELAVFHVTDDLESVIEINSTINYSEDAAVIEAEHFSIYTVVIVSGNKSGKIFHYYQGPTKAKSYFTIYNEEELLNYVDLLNSYQSGTLSDADGIQTILVNSDEANPIEGITGNGQSETLKIRDLYFSAKIMDDITVNKLWSPIKLVPTGVTIDGNGKVLRFTNIGTVNISMGDYGVFVKENQGLIKNVILSGDYTINIFGSVNIGGIVGYNDGTIINSIFNNGGINVSGYANANTGLVVGRLSSAATVSNIYIQGDESVKTIGNDTLGTTYNIIKGTTAYPSSEQITILNQWVENSGTVSTGTLYWSETGLVKDKPESTPSEEETKPLGSARVTIRVDGRKAEIGQAITGAEALAIREVGNDSAPYITLVRSDDLSVYETDLANLESDKDYNIFYVYEDENETISSSDGSLFISRNHKEVTIEYVSVKYNIEGANTYKKVSDGKGGYKLSENIMAAVRVNPIGDGTYHALEDYTAVIKAVEGYDIPISDTKVTVTIGGVELKTGVSYVYNSETEEGTITVSKNVITGPIKVDVKARELTDNPSCTVILHTKGGSIGDPLWEKDTNDPYKYTKIMYQEETLTLPIPNTYLNSTSVNFAGWYKSVTPSGQAVSNVDFKKGETYHFYAEYILAKGENNPSNTAEGSNGKMWYSYANYGNADVRGIINGNTFRTTYSDQGFSLAYAIGELSRSTGSGTPFRTNQSVGQSAFVNVYGNIWVSQQFTFDGNYIYITYIFENRNQTGAFNQKFNLALGADIQIGSGYNSDRATIAKTANYITMTSKATSADEKDEAFVLYIDGKEFGVDKIDRYWYGYYHNSGYAGNGYWYNNMFAPSPDSSYDGTSDSAMSYGWTINSIPAGGIVTRSLKIGAGDATSLSNLSGTFMSGLGSFNDGKTNYSFESRNKNIEVKENGEVWVDNVKRIDPNLTNVQSSSSVKSLKRDGYKFAYWSTTDADYSSNPTKFTGKLSDNLTLYSIWVPKPDRYVKNASSIQKVKGNDNLIVPKELGSITIVNTTPGSTDSNGKETLIKQGEVVQEAAGYASGFSGIMEIDGADDRYLLPDDITVTIIGTNGTRTILTKGTGYEYRVWNNRKKATIIVRNQFINGDVEIKAVGYELPPVTATSLSTSVKAFTLKSGETAEFTVHAETSKNHVASYQWYVAPYYEITLDNKLYWTYQNQNGTAISNGNQTLWGVPVLVSGADKDTLRINGLTVNPAGLSTNDIGLHKGGYHVYCVVTSTRNITGQQVVAVSTVAEVEVTQGQYPAPTGLTGSAATYKGNPGSADGKVIISHQENRPGTLQYRKKGNSSWIKVNKGATEITGLVAGTYQFMYAADSENTASSTTEIVVGEGRQINVVYKANGGKMIVVNSNEVSLEYDTIEKSVDYGSSVSATSLGIPSPIKTGSVFSGWNKDNISFITEDTEITAQYSNNIIAITLDNQGADGETKGSLKIYEKYGQGFYKEDACINLVSGDNPIDLPQKSGFDFQGYYSGIEDGVRMINPDGCLNSNIGNTSFLKEQTIYARWTKKPTAFNSPNGVVSAKEKDEGGYSVTVTNNTGKDANIIYVYIDGELNEELTIYPATFTDNKYTFELSDSISGNVTFVVGNKESSEPGEPLGITYNIFYKNVDGSRLGGEFEGTFTTTKPDQGVKGVKVNLPSVIRTGYTFVGWFTTARGTGNSIITIPETYDSDITLYAKWKANKYTLALETDGGEFVDGYSPAVQYEHGAEPEVILPTAMDIKKEGYTFGGWYKNADLGSDGANSVTKVDKTQIGKVTYYLKWDEIPSRSVTFTGDGQGNKIYLIEDLDKKTSPINVLKGSPYSFKVILRSSSYRIETVYANGRPIFAVNGVYTIDAVNDNMVITVETKQLAKTDSELAHPNAVAYIDLPDGTTAFFEPEGVSTEESRAAALKKAIDFATSEYQGTEQLTVKLNVDIKNQSIVVGGSNPVTLDLNGHRITKTDGGTEALLIEDGGSLQIANSSETNFGEGYLTIPVENNGNLEIDTGIVIDELKNYSETTNHGHIKTLLQQNGEIQGEVKVSRLDSSDGIVDQGELKGGYLVSGPNMDVKQIAGYTTVMNGNQYYFDFQTAVDIASNTEGDSVITIGKDVDLNTGGSNQTITVGKEGKNIFIDLNGHNIHNGTINVVGDVTIVNNSPASGGNTVDSVINNKNAGNLTVGKEGTDDTVKLNGKIVNEGTLNVLSGGSIGGSSGILNNSDGTINNNGTITALITNNGDVTNNGTMNNVEQKGGHLNNNGVIESSIALEGGSYTPGTDENVTPKVPTSGVTLTMGTVPETITKYYANIKDAIADINNIPEGENTPLVIKLSEDITINEDLEINPNNSQISVTVDLNGHNISPVTGGGAGSSSGSLSISGGSVKFDDTSSGTKGVVSVDVKVDDGNLDNNIKINSIINNGGTINNNGEITNLTQTGGQTNNKEGGSISSLTQTGGVTGNEGTITLATLNGGGFTGEGVISQGGEPVAEFDGKSFLTLQAALLYAAQNGGGEVTLLKNTDEKITFAPGSGASPVTLKLGEGEGNPTITGEGSVTLGDGAKLKITGTETFVPAGGVAQIGDIIYGDLANAASDANSSEKDVVIKLLDNTGIPSGSTEGGLSISNKNGKKIVIDLNGKDLGTGERDGTLIVSSELEIVDNSTKEGVETNASVKAPVIVNEDAALTIGENSNISGALTNSGRIDNQGTITGPLNHNGGQFTGNPATGSETTGGVQLKTKDEKGNPVTKFYPDLKSAAESAKEGDEITLLKDVDGTEGNIENVTISKPGVSIDLNGHTIGNYVNINITEGASNPGVIINNSKGASEQSGGITGTINNNGGLNIMSNTGVKDVVNNGTLNNSGTISGTLNQTGGKTTNNGTVSNLVQTGGTTNNTGSVVSAEITGGGYAGEMPEDSTESIPEGSKVKIGNNYYADFESAIAAANKSQADVTIEILENIEINNETIRLGNENGKVITLDLHGHNVTSAQGEKAVLSLVSPGQVVVKDSDADLSKGGVLDLDITVNQGASLEISELTDVGGNGNITNSGSVVNRGTILGEVTNQPEGTFTNNNSGVMVGEIVNTGTFTNQGNIENDVTNDLSGKFVNSNTGIINGQLENTGNAATENSGSIIQVNVSGGRLNNKEGANISTLLQVGGELENSGEIKEVEGACAILIYVDNSGKTRREYVSSIEEAIEIAETIDSDVTVTLTEDVPQKDNIVINKQNGSLNINLNGYSIGSGSRSIEVSGGSVIIKDSSPEGSGGVLSPIKQTGGSMKLEGGDYYGVTLSPENDSTKMRTDLTGGNYSKAPGTNQPAILVTGSNAQNTLLNAFGQSGITTNTIRTDSGNGVNLSLDNNGNISLTANAGEKLQVVSVNKNDSIKSDLELLQRLNEDNKANTIITANGVKLNQDITLTDTLNIDGNISLDLNGKTLTGPSGDRKLDKDDEATDQTGKPAINLENGSNVNITGSGTIKGGRGASNMQQGIDAGKGGAAITYNGSADSNDGTGTISASGQGVVLTESNGTDGFALGNNPPEILLNNEERHPELLNDFHEKLYDLEVKVKEDIEGTVSENKIVGKDVKVSLDVPVILADIGVTDRTTKIDVSINIVQKEHAGDDPGATEINLIKDYIISDLIYIHPELKEEESILGMVVDITLNKTLYEDDGTNPVVNNKLISELAEEMVFTINLPKDMQGGSNYKVIRYHEESGSGEVSLINCTTDNAAYPKAITFSSRKFSYFGIVYTPKAEGVVDPDAPTYNFNYSGGNDKREEIPVYRLYNRTNGDHLLTVNSKEKDLCVKSGWTYEGIAFIVYNDGEKVYRLYNPNSGEHFYTVKEEEKEVLCNLGWRYEGVAFSTQGKESVYRLYNGKMHFFTRNANEKDVLVRLGWQLEPVAFYVTSAK